MKAILFMVVVATASVGMAKGKSGTHGKSASHSKAATAKGDCQGLKGKELGQCMKAHKAQSTTEETTTPEGGAQQ